MFRSLLNLPQRYTPFRHKHNVAKFGNLLPFSVKTKQKKSARFRNQADLP